MLIGIALLALLQPTVPDGARKAGPATPQSATVYHVDAGKFTFEYPMSFQDHTAASQAVLAKQRADAKAKGETPSGCSEVVFDGQGLNDSAESSIIVVKLDMACLKKQPTDVFLMNFLTRIVQGKKKEPTDEFTNPRLYMLSLHRAVVSRGSVTQRNGRQSSIVDTCAVAEGNLYCWTLKSGNEKQVDGMAHLLVTFDGSEPAPLVPPALPKTR